MATGEDNSKQEPGRGFAGLSSMLSNIDVPQSVNDGVPDDASGKSGDHPNAAKVAKSNQSPTPLPFDKDSETSRASTAFKWVLGIAAGIGILWFISAVNENSTYQPTTNSPAVNVRSGAEPDSVSGEAASTALGAQAPSAVANSEQPAAPPARPSFDKPPIGRDLVLTVAQIRYCLGAGYMLDGAKPAVNQYSDEAVDRFNGMVADYNSRCSQFRYRQGDLESARREVNPYQEQLQAEGRRLFASNGKASSTVQTTPTATVRNVQRLLNDLGYNVGIVDGVMGTRTRSAIEAFQRAEGLMPDGRITSELLASLKSSLAKTLSIRQRSGHGVPPSIRNSESVTPAAKSTGISGDTNNYKTCISGNYPYSCNHSLLTPEEKSKVAAAERRANFQTCISGSYPYSCKHSLLTSDEATQVAAAERRANFQTCISGRYPYSCKHSLLTREEKSQVAAAERRINFQTCISGHYPYSCKHSLLTPEEAKRVAAAEKSARGRSN